MIIKKDIGLKELIALATLIDSPEAALGQQDTGDKKIYTEHGSVNQKSVIRFKGNIGVSPDGDEFSVTVEIDEGVGLIESIDSATYMALPGRFLTRLHKALGSPLE